ncbi:MAG: InlB B-repeat-containing protein [Clostridia bacterium]|nr:InlB B-repeat-containing protein [Clostridia bacterium]
MKKHLFLFAFVVLTLTVLLSGCGGGGQELDGMYTATFELNGGTLSTQNTSISTKVNYAYEPNSYILDPANYATYKVFRPGYVFTGWYTDAECTEQNKWDFAQDKIESEKITLYAGWEKEILYTFTVCYVNGEETVTLGSYNVKPGATFEDYRNHANKRDDHTPVGYFSDAACTTPWDFTTAHPGGESDLDIRVYVDYIEGDWKLVSNFGELENAIGVENIYLTADIDCGGEVLSFGNTFTHTLQGNGFKISNFTVETFGSALMPSISLFRSLGEGAEILNVTFDDVLYDFTGGTGATKMKVAALARDAKNCTVSNVTITGKFQTEYTGELLDLSFLEKAFYEEGSEGTLTNFVIDITVEILSTGDET